VANSGDEKSARHNPGCLTSLYLTEFV